MILPTLLLLAVPNGADATSVIEVNGRIQCSILEPADHLNPLTREQGHAHEQDQPLITRFDDIQKCEVRLVALQGSGTSV